MIKKLSPYLSGLVELALALILPIPLVLTFLVGLPSEKMPHAMTFSLGIFAYVWMLLTLYISVKPSWLSQFINTRIAYINQLLLTSIALVTSFFHQNMNLSSGVNLIVAMLTFSVLVVFVGYSIIYSLAKSLLIKPLGIYQNRLRMIVTTLNSLGVVMVLLHVHLISYVRANILFMVLCDGMSIPIITYIIYKWLRPVQKTAKQLN